PQRTARMWYSRKYHMSPMPYSVFFHGGYAIHGTGAVRQLGRPASHGCVRLHTANAATFYSMVREVGFGNTRIVVTN
ncbi:L,D-transpeptidase, partial [Mesorhizobium sp. M7A.F.Ca.US.005.03.2.1]